MVTMTQFNMTNFKILPIGETIITLKKSDQKFSIKRAETSLHNYIVGEMYLWHSGEMVCENLNSKAKAVLDLKQLGWFSSDEDYFANGFIYNSKGDVTHLLEGCWNKELNAIC